MSSFLNKLKQANEFEPKFYTKFEKDIPIYQFDLSKDLDHVEIVKNILDIQKELPISRTSSIHAWHTEYYTLMETKKFSRLAEIVEEKVKGIDAYFEWELKVYEYWAIVYKKFDHTDFHDHGVAALSWVYYAQTYEDSPPLIFKDGLSIQPKDGMLIMFPSYVDHGVPKSKSEKERIVISGNLFLKKLIDR